MRPSEHPISPFRLACWIGAGIFCLALLRILWLQFGPPGVFIGAIAILVAFGAIGLAKGVVHFRRAIASPQPSRREEPEEEASEKRSRLIRQFVFGCVLYLVFVCPLLASLTGCNLFLVFFAVMTGLIFTGTMVVVWATSRAIRKDTRQNQFSILTLMFLTLIAAIYLGAIRWLADLAGDQLGAGGRRFLAAAFICVILTFVTMPFLLLIMESLVWFAAWLVRRPWVQGWLRRR